MAGVMEQVEGYRKLYALVEELITNKPIFSSILRDLKSKLDSFQLFFQQMAQHDNFMDQGLTEELGSQMEQGEVLLQKCSKMTTWNIYKKHKYTNKLLELDESLKKLFTKLNIKVAGDVQAVQQSIVSLGINTEAGIYRTKHSTALPPLPRFIVGMDAPLTQVKMKLLKDEKSTILVLTGPAGCGKTTLATMFCNDEHVKGVFQDNIFFETISMKPSYEVIVNQLFQQKGLQVPQMVNDEVAVTVLQQFLKHVGEKPLLLVLDDVWPGAESHIQQCYESYDCDDVKMPNFKILVTSRYDFPGFGSPYRLESLNEENSMTLFRHSASLGDKSPYIPDNILKKTVEHCKGIPLAIKVVGISLCGQPVELWQKRVVEWSKGSSIFDTHTELFLCFQSSLDALEPGLKECFLDLGSFPQHRKISIAAILDMWIELYDLDDEFFCIANIYQITARNLAKHITPRKVEMEEDRYYDDEFVTQHDLLRDLAIYQAKLMPIEDRERLIIDIFEDNIPKWWREQKYPTLIARLVSISTDSKFSMKWHNIHLPKAQVLVLNFVANYALPEFVETMDSLKVMIVTNHGPLPVELSNIQLLASLSCLKIIRLEHISIASITTNHIQLKMLQKISFFKCDIGEAFISINISDAFPNLEELTIDHCTDLVELPNELCDLGFLKRLCITNCPKISALPEEIGKLVRLEVLRLRSCADLKKLPDSIKTLKKLSLLDISGCRSIEELQDNFGEMSSLQLINMRQCSSLQKLPPLLDLEQLEAVLCDEDTEALWKPFLPNSKVKMPKKEVSSEI